MVYLLIGDEWYSLRLHGLQTHNLLTQTPTGLRAIWLMGPEPGDLVSAMEDEDEASLREIRVSTTIDDAGSLVGARMPTPRQLRPDGEVELSFRVDRDPEPFDLDEFSTLLAEARDLESLPAVSLIGEIVELSHDCDLSHSSPELFGGCLEAVFGDMSVSEAEESHALLFC